MNNLVELHDEKHNKRQYENIFAKKKKRRKERKDAIIFNGKCNGPKIQYPAQNLRWQPKLAPWGSNCFFSLPRP